MSISRGLARFLGGVAAVVVSVSVLPAVHPFGKPPPPAVPPRVGAGAPAAYGKLPLVFEANLGQADPGYRFLARGPGYTAGLTDTEVVFNPAGSARTAAIRLAPVRASTARQVSGRGLLPGKVNYFIGNDPTRWRTDVPTYAEVVYQDLYPGIDMVYHDSGGGLEQDFVVAPGADPSVIALRVTGTTGLAPDAEGGLSFGQGAPFSLGRPHLYQEGGVEVAGSYQARRADQFGFQVGAYDHSRPLVIDPVIGYATYLGGAGPDNLGGMALDGAGSVYVTGSTQSSNFPTLSPYQGSLAGQSAAFIAKLNASGSSLLYSTYLGGTGSTGAIAVAVDGTSAAYLTGYSSSTDFPTTAGAFQRSGNANGAAFMTKLSPGGDSLVYSTLLGGSARTVGISVALGGNGNAYLAGWTTSTDFPTSAGAFQTSLRGTQNAFLTELSPAGSTLAYSTYLGGSQSDAATGLGIDGAGNAVVVGSTGSTDFPAVGPELNAYSGGGPCSVSDYVVRCRTGFVAKINATATALVYSSFLGGDLGASVNGVAVDFAGDAYLTGFTASASFPVTPGAYQTVLNRVQDAFVTKLNPAGAIVYSTLLGGSGYNGIGWDSGQAIAVNAAGNAYLTGATYSDRFPTVRSVQAGPGGATDAYGQTDGDAFVSELDPAGQALLFSTYLGGPTTENGRAVAVDGRGTIYAAGSVSNADLAHPYSQSRAAQFPVTQGGFQKGFGTGTSHGFVTKIVPVPGAVNSASYHLDTANDGGFGSWVEIDPALEVTKTPTADSTAVVSANIDLWTAQAGYNQDVGIFVSTDSGPDTLVAWKESGGFAGTFSPNAAFAEVAVPVLAGHTYLFKLKWKPNRAAPAGAIYGGAGTASTQFSPTRLTVRMVASGLVSYATQRKSYHLDAATDGATWTAVDPALDVTVAGTEATLAIGAGMDLWTTAVGYNQDLGVFVSVDGGPDSLLAWKESGGFAGTYSPNAAHVLATYPTHGGHSYTFRLKWKANQPAPGGTVFGGAGTAATQFSPTTLMVEQLPAGTAQFASTHSSYQLASANQGLLSSWLELDSGNRVSLTPAVASNAVITGNLDLWTAAAGYNQDVGVFSCDWTNNDCSQFANYILIGWKESGGFAGTLSPNAATVQAMLGLEAGHAYTFSLGWKANRPAPAGAVYAAAGTVQSGFSPTSVLVQLGG